MIVDSTRKGKRFPDSMSKTIPIWTCVLNRSVYNYRKNMCKGFALVEGVSNVHVLFFFNHLISNYRSELCANWCNLVRFWLLVQFTMRLRVLLIPSKVVSSS